MAIRFDGRVAIVTGAGGGLGRAHALELARRGAQVVVNDLGARMDGTGGSSEAAEAVVAEIEAMGGRAIANGSSVADDKGVETLAREALEAFGRIDILINNAGILRDKTFHKMPMADFEAVLSVHLIGTVKATKAVWPVMREQTYGRIIVTTSSSGLFGNFGQSNYAAAKLAVVGLVNALRLEGEKHDIRCNALSPVAWTRMTSGHFPPESKEIFKPERVAPAAAYLACEEAPSGAILCAGAGAFARAEIVESEGVYLGAEPSAEDIARNWDRIGDMSGAERLGRAGEQTAKFFDLAARS